MGIAGAPKPFQDCAAVVFQLIPQNELSQIDRFIITNRLPPNGRKKSSKES
jgi:hypothetical protein